MEKILKLYTYVDGTNDAPFPSADEQVIIGSFTYTANRMGSAPQIAATVMHRLCLDDLWNDKVYAEFNGEKYFVINTPSSSKSNDDTRYEHDLELLSEREILNHVYFIDAVQGDSDTDVYKSNSTKVQFYGNLEQFVGRLNASLSYRNLGYSAVIDDGITSEDKQVSFEDKYILEALQEEFNIFEIPYYFVGKVIHFGYTSNAITTTFKYGHDDAFLSISKDNANYALINRITGVGSSDNIPYYYPNETDDQSAVEASGKKWITPSQNLMPSIYRESEGAEMFYEAKNNTYPDGEGGYYQFENEYSVTNPREGKTDFEDIKPTITGITNAAGQRIDMFSEFAYDTNDNDEVDEEGNYLHPYFFAKLRKTDGTYGFNLFDHAIESQTMQITFTSGICGACTFEIAVGEDTQKNLVQVGETSGALMRDEDGNVLCGREDLQQPQTPQDRQNDTKNYEVWIALRKDNSTYPQVMPNVNYNYKPSTSDTFAILGISLPQAYILKAEDELEKSLVKHMWMNNVEKFTFSAKFSRIFFTEHPEVLAQLNENARVIIEYNGKQHTLYIDNYSYKMDASSPLPEIDVDLVDTLTIGKNSLQTQLDSVKQDILSSIGAGDFLKQGLKYFLRKDKEDGTNFLLKFGKFIDSMSAGKGAGIFPDGRGQFERLQVRSSLEVLETIFNRLSAMEGDYTFSESGTIENIIAMSDGTYTLQMRKRWENDFTALAEHDVIYGVVNDLASGSGSFYTSWMRVLSVNTTANTLSVVLYPDEEVPGGVNHAPEPLMVVTRRGNPVNEERQGWWYLSSYERCICMLEGVTKPILEEDNYYVIIGRLKHLSLFDNLPINYRHSYVFCRGIVTNDIQTVDWQGELPRVANDRGEWSLETAQGEEPYNAGRQVDTGTGLAEMYDTVWHYGCQWMCLVTGTTDEPRYGAAGWAMIQGNPSFTVDIDSSNGWHFDAERFATTLSVKGTLYNQDVTDSILDQDVQWTRDTGNVTEDNAWATAHAEAGKSIDLTVDDLGPDYMTLTGCKFIVTVLLRDGQEELEAQDFVSF